MTSNVMLLVILSQLAKDHKTPLDSSLRSE